MAAQIQTAEAEELLAQGIKQGSISAANWRVKGEGAANLVLAYKGSIPKLRGVIVRVRKPNAPGVITPLDEEIWSGTFPWTSESVRREVTYVSCVMAPRLGHSHVFPGILCPFPQSLWSLTSLDEDTASRAKALLLPDHTTFSQIPPGYRPVGPTVCLEIKPKCGFIPEEDLAATSSDIKLQCPRFVLHMVHKHVVHKQELTLYNPLDLFSGDPARIQHALWQLVHVPSNNLRVFRDGQLIYGGRQADKNESAAYDNPTLSRTQLHLGLSGFVNDAASNRGGAGNGCSREGEGAALDEQPALQALVRVAAGALHNEGVLQQLLEVQRLDKLGVEAVQQLYQELLEGGAPGEEAPGSEPSTSATVVTKSEQWVDESGRTTSFGAEQTITVVEEAGDGSAATAEAKAAARRARREAALAAVRDYLIAATAKDCGLMVTIQRVEQAADGGSNNGAGASSAGSEPTPNGAGDAAAQEPLAASLAELLQQPLVRVLHDSEAGGGGCSYVVKVAFVDLDIKTSNKIPAHLELEQELLACAVEHEGVLLSLMAAMRSAGSAGSSV